METVNVMTTEKKVRGGGQIIAHGVADASDANGRRIGPRGLHFEVAPEDRDLGRPWGRGAVVHGAVGAGRD